MSDGLEWDDVGPGPRPLFVDGVSKEHGPGRNTELGSRRTRCRWGEAVDGVVDSTNRLTGRSFDQDPSGGEDGPSSRRRRLRRGGTGPKPHKTRGWDVVSESKVGGQGGGVSQVRSFLGRREKFPEDGTGQGRGAELGHDRDIGLSISRTPVDRLQTPETKWESKRSTPYERDERIVWRSPSTNYTVLGSKPRHL